MLPKLTRCSIGAFPALALLLVIAGLAPRQSVARVLDARERVHLQLGAGAQSLTLAQIAGDWQPEIVGNSTGFSAYTRADSGWKLLLSGSDNFSGFASFEDAAPFQRVGLYTNISFGNGSAPVLGGVFPDASPQFHWRPMAFVLGSSNWTVGEWPGRFSHASISIGQNNENYSPAVYVPVSGNPGRVYLCDLWSIPGNGTAGTSIPFITAANAKATANDFFNVDFRPDVAVACAGTGPGTAAVSVLMHTSPTTFAPRVDYPVGDGPVDIVAGHFGGTRADLAVACAGANSISYLRNNGDGTFAPASFLAANGHSGMRSIHVADVNQDDYRDLVVFYSTSILDGAPGGVGVRFGAGNQEFGSEIFTPIGAGLHDGAVADMNGDGFPDVVVSIPDPGYGDRVQILYGRGDGTFGGGLSSNNATLLVPQPHQMMLGDFDGDLSAGGPTDDILIGVPSQSPAPNLYLQPTIPGSTPAAIGTRFDNGFLGMAGGHFFDSPESPAPLDLLLGAIPPLAVPGVHTPLGFGTPVELGCDFTEDFDGPPVAVDLDGDGFDDAVSAMHVAPSLTGPGKLEWCMNNGDGTFATYQSVVTAPNPRQALAADFDADGAADVISIGAPNTVAFHRNLGAGALDDAVNTTLPFSVPSSGSLGPNYYAPTHVAALARFSGPSAPPHLLVLESDPPLIAEFEFNGAGGFTLVSELATASNPIAVAAGDLDGDGWLDLVAACEGFVSPDSDRERILTVWYNDGTNSFSRRADYDLDSDGLMDMQVGDLTGDGTASVAILSWGGPRSVPQDLAHGPMHALASGGVRLGALASFEPTTTEVLAVPPSPVAAGSLSLAIRPNPARTLADLSFTLSRAGEVQAEVFDLSGRCIWASPRIAASPGTASLSWDGRTSDGSRVGSGLYLVRVSTPEGVRRGRVAWLR